MEVIETSSLTAGQKENILQLWNQEYPEKLMYDNISGLENYLDGLNDKKHFLLIGDSNKILGWSFTFDRHNERWFAIILDHTIHGLGYGKLLLDKLKDRSSKLSGWVIDHSLDKKFNGEYYPSPLNFYLKNDFMVAPGMRLESDKLSAVKIEWVNKISL